MEQIDSNASINSNLSQKARFATDIEDNAQKYINNYPSCVKEGKLQKTQKGEYVMVLNRADVIGYQFYISGRVRKPDGKMSDYFCGGRTGRDIYVDDVNLTAEWNKKFRAQNSTTTYEKGEQNKIKTQGQNIENIYGPAVEFYKEHNHTINLIAGVALSLVGGPFGVAIAMGIGGMDAYQYHMEGDNKKAGITAIFALLPGVGGLANKLGIGQWSAKALSSIGKKLSQGATLSNAEAQVVLRVGQNREIIKSAMEKMGKDVTIRMGKEAARKQLARKAALKQTGKFGGTIGGYIGAEAGYNKAYDYLNPTMDFSQIQNMDLSQISDVNKQAAANLKFD